MTDSSDSSGVTDGSWLSALADWTVSLMDVIGPAGAGIAIALENLFPPLPSEIILPMAGLAASRGSFTLFEAIAWTTAGSVVGAFLLYGLGAAFGVRPLRWFAAKAPLLNPDDVDRTVAWFHRHGWKAVFFGRMVPIFRSLISIPAGVARMPLWSFGLLTAAGSALWNSIFVLAGYFLGESWHIVEQYTGILQYVVIIGVIGGVGLFVFLRVRERIRARRARDARDGEQPVAGRESADPPAADTP